MRPPLFLLGFILGIVSQDPKVAAVAYDLGAFIRCTVTDCQE